MAIPTQLLESALALPPSEREDLVAKLIISLDDGPKDEGYDEAWAQEIADRIGRLERGEERTHEWPEVLARVQQSLRERARR